MVRFWFKRSAPPPEDETSAAAEGIVITQADVAEMPAELLAPPAPPPPPRKRPADESFVISLSPLGTQDRLREITDLKTLVRQLGNEAREARNKATGG